MCVCRVCVQYWSEWKQCGMPMAVRNIHVTRTWVFGSRAHVRTCTSRQRGGRPSALISHCCPFQSQTPARSMCMGALQWHEMLTAAYASITC